MLGAASVSLVLDVLQPERSALVQLLIGLGPEDWARPTECPAYCVKGVATHLLGDDLSLLSRQRDQAIDGTTLALHSSTTTFPARTAHVERPTTRTT
jgi:hypothetical protein